MIKITSLGNELEEFDNDKSSLALLIDVDGKKILFDTGKEDEIITNSKKTKVNLDEVEAIVLSHGHNDHTGGLKFLDKSKKIIAHPGAFEKKLFDGKDIGCPVKKEECSNLTLTKESYELFDGSVTFVGEIPRDSESVEPIGTLENGEPDKLMDDSCLVIKSKNGNVIVFGSAHSGVVNTVKYVKENFEGEISAVVGGLHCLNDEAKLKRILKCFEDNKIVDVYPMHSLCKDSFKIFDKLDSKKVNTLETIYLAY